MILLGINIEIVLMSSTAAIMSAASTAKATAAAAIEGMAYELGAGLGVTIFGLMLSFFYMQHLNYPSGFSPTQMDQLGHSIGETLQAVTHLDSTTATEVTDFAAAAFTVSHSIVLLVAGGLFFLLAILIWRHMPTQRPANETD